MITTIIGRYWYLQNVTLNNNVYRYFAFGMSDLMTTPPTYSYVCTTATFIRYNNSTTNLAQYNFTDQFYLLGLQVNRNDFLQSKFFLLFNLVSTI